MKTALLMTTLLLKGLQMSGNTLNDKKSALNCDSGLELESGETGALVRIERSAPNWDSDLGLDLGETGALNCDADLELVCNLLEQAFDQAVENEDWEQFCRLMKAQSMVNGKLVEQAFKDVAEMQEALDWMKKNRLRNCSHDDSLAAWKRLFPKDQT